MSKNKIRSYKREDAFRTYTGQLMTRKQLGTEIAKLNKKYRNPKYLMKYMSMGEYIQARKFYTELSKNVYGTVKAFSIRGVHDVTELKQIEQAVRRLSSSFYYDKSHYEESKAKQLSALSTTFTHISEDRLQHLYEVFKTDSWHHLIENELLNSTQAIDLFDKYGGLSDDKIQDIVYMLENVEKEAAKKNMDVDDMLELMLETYSENIW